MKRGLTKGVLLSIFLLVFLSSSIFAAAPAPGTCAISLRTECLEANGNYILMGMSSSTNAHGQTDSATPLYPYVLCCGLGTGDNVCDGSNKIIGLSSITNAHAEVPSGTLYNTNICYEDFECVGTTATSCPVGSVGILSLTATTNAHIGNSTDYPIKICCTSSFLASACSFSTASWSRTNADAGWEVKLSVTGVGTECDGQSVSFNVLEYDFLGTDNSVTCDASASRDSTGDATCGLNVAFDGSTATGIWYAEYQDDAGDPEYYFNVSRAKNRGVSLTSSTDSDKLLTVSEKDEDVCEQVSSCADYTIEEDCNSDVGLCNVAAEVVSDELDCSSENVVCACSWDEEDNECAFGYAEIEQEDCGTPEDGCNYGCTLCTDGTTKSCILGSTCTTGLPATDNDGICESGIDGCASTDCSDGEKDSCAIGLYCLDKKCSSVEGPPLTTGRCEVVQKVKDNCDTLGSKSIDWEGTWTGSRENCGVPDSACTKCEVKSSMTLPCPAQVQLPFFDYYELVITVIVIALIYVSLIFKRKFGKKFKGKK